MKFSIALFATLLCSSSVVASPFPGGYGTASGYPPAPTGYVKPRAHLHAGKPADAAMNPAKRGLNNRRDVSWNETAIAEEEKVKRLVLQPRGYPTASAPPPPPTGGYYA
ncbi:MAG: hypothetical protein M4579_005580 [Chaenotheca gracillima]|nr:MAG: hypothetical protein M4579_005580 [Chaenotheca gracillima]